MDPDLLSQIRFEESRFIKPGQWDILAEDGPFSLPSDLPSTLRYVLPDGITIDADSEEEDGELPPLPWLGSHIKRGPRLSKEQYMTQANMYFHMLMLSRENKEYSARNANPVHIRQKQMLLSLLNILGYGIYRGWPSLTLKTWNPEYYDDTTPGNSYSNF